VFLFDFILLLACRFFEDPLEQIRAQMDVNSCMNKSAGNTWFTQPLTNFGLFIVKSHPFSIKAFRQASKQYKRIPLLKKTTVATDQNVVGGAIKWARWRYIMSCESSLPVLFCQHIYLVGLALVL